MLRAVAASVATVGSLLGLLFVVGLAAVAGTAAPTAEALADIPPAYVVLYQDAAAQRCPTLPWSILAAIGKIESNHGRIGGGALQRDGRIEPPIIGVPLDGAVGTHKILDTDGGRFDGDDVYDHAVGPMQFIPTTWAASGIDASGDGVTDPHNAVDATHTTAAHLCAAGASDSSRVRDAIFAYNHSWHYVEEVLSLAAGYAAGGVGSVPASPTLVALVLANPRLHIYEAGRRDIAAGRVDARVLTVLQLASEQHTLRISSLKTGHSRCVGGGDYDGCRVSHHWHGRAADISMVDGRPVSASNSSARNTALWLGTRPESLRPAEVGTPWADLRTTPFFHDPDHLTHLHLGYGSKG